MADIIKFKSASHWYCKDGTPKHDADLRIARKEFLYPSPTSIEKDVFKNYGLEKYKIQQLLMAAGSSPRQPHESDDDYYQKIYDISGEHAEAAAGFGQGMHAELDNYPKGPMLPVYAPWYDQFADWHAKTISLRLASEIVLVDHDIGVAGRGDLIAMLMDGRRAIVDYKTQDIKTDDKGRKKPMFYDSWCRQLSFYNVADAKMNNLFPNIAACISLILDSNPSGLLYAKEWTHEEILSSYEDFLIGCYKWFKSKGKCGYWPAQNGKWTITPNMAMPI